MRELNEYAHVPGQYLRELSESTREEDESMRELNEYAHVPGQYLRELSESTREEDESMRVPDESMRVPDESMRVPDEYMRVPDEHTRERNEYAHVPGEIPPGRLRPPRFGSKVWVFRACLDPGRRQGARVPGSGPRAPGRCFQAKDG
jgi:hypothetical protein